MFLFKKKCIAFIIAFIHLFRDFFAWILSSLVYLQAKGWKNKSIGLITC